MTQSAGLANTQGLVNTERPSWSLPNGNVPDIVARYYLRSDTPTGRSTEQPPPEAVDAFRQMLAAGAIVPNNASAAAMAVSEGGIRNGDPSPFGVPWIDGLPGGMTADQWNANTARIAQISQQRIAEAEMSGYFTGPDGQPISTLARQQIEAQIKSQVTQDETSRMLANSEISRRDRELDRLELERQDAVRAGDLDRAQELGIEIDRQKFKREELAQAAGIAVGEVGGRSTLAAQQQAFDQQQKQAELASNPRTALQGWIFGQRGGIAGQPVGNQVTPTTNLTPEGGVTGTTQNTQPGVTGPGAAPVGATTQGAQGAFGQALAGTNAAPGLTASFQVPTSAFQEALIQGRPVATQGDIQTQGRFRDTSEVQGGAVNPAQWRTQDYMRGTNDEQQGALGLASLAGFSDETTQDLLRRNLPRFTAPTASGIG